MGTFLKIFRGSAFLFSGLLAISCSKDNTSQLEFSNGLRGLTGSPTCPSAIGDATISGRPATVLSHGSVTVASGTVLNYSVTTGYLPIYAQGTQTGPVNACMFFFAYTRDDHKGDPSWPVSFLSNGGPGSDSDWIHLGGLGPKTINLGSEGISTSPTSLVDDANTLLQYSDLVFVDPINTGYSRVASGVNPTNYDGLDQEADSIGDFILGYLQKYGRQTSPRYVVGESYGGMRLPVLGRYLDEQLGIKATGLVFISPWLDSIGDDTADMADDLPYVTLLPQFAATAWYQKKLSASLQALDVATVFNQAQAFATGDYISALAQGNDLPAATRTTIAATLSNYTGLTQDFILNSNLRISADIFRVQLLAAQNLTLSYYDGRMSAVLATPATQDPTDAFNAIFANIESAYFPSTLGIVTDLPYQENNYPAWPGAPVDQIDGGYLRVLSDLTTLLQEDASLQIFMANGYYDFVCPPGEVHYMVNHLPADVASRITLASYPGGHPVYFGADARASFVKDIAPLFSATTIQVASEN